MKIDLNVLGLAMKNIIIEYLNNAAWPEKVDKHLYPLVVSITRETLMWHWREHGAQPQC